MRRKLLSLCMLVACSSAALNSFSQKIISGIYNIPGNVTLTSSVTISVTSIGTAIDALNIYGVQSGGTVQFNLADGYTETATGTNGTGLGQYTIGGTGSAIFSTSYAAVIFKHNGNGTNPLLTATNTASGAADYIIRLLGADNITFDGIDLQENPANSTSSACMEYGYFLANGANGCQYNIIEHCKITMNRTDFFSVGIYQNNTDNTTSNSYNIFDGVTVYNSYRGIVLVGKTGSPDNNCEIKNCRIGDPLTIGDIGSSISVVTTNNAIGISVDYQNNIAIHSCIINNVYYFGTESSGPFAAGVYLSNLFGTSYFSENSISGIHNATNSTSPRPYGIYFSGSGGNTFIYNNFIADVNYTGSGTSTTIKVQPIYFTGTGNVGFYFNSLNFYGTLTCSATALEVNGPAVDIKNNLIKYSGWSGFGGSRSFYGISLQSGTVTADYNMYSSGTNITNSTYYIARNGTTNVALLGPATTAGSWMNVSGSDLNSVVAVPNYISALGNNLHLNFSTYDNNYQATSISNPLIKTDIDTLFNSHADPLLFPLKGADQFTTTTGVLIASNQPKDSLVQQAASNRILAGITLSPLGSAATFTGININTAGIFTTSSAIDFGYFKLFINTLPSIIGATQLGSAIINAPATTTGALNFNGFSANLISGNTYYVFVVDSVGITAMAGNKISASTISFSNIIFSGTVTKIGADPIVASGLQTVAQCFYNYANTDITLTTSWHEKLSGSNLNPTNFTSGNQVFIVENNGATMSAAWNVAGANNKINIGDGTKTILIEATFPIVTTGGASMDVFDKATIKFETSYTPTVLANLFNGITTTPGSTVEYGDNNSTPTVDTVIAANYCNLIFSGISSGTRTYKPNSIIGVSNIFNPGSFTATQNGMINFNGTTVAQIIPANYLFNNLRITNTAATTTMAGDVAVDSAFSIKLALANLTVAAGQTLTLTQNASVEPLFGTLYINGSLTNNNPLTTVFAGNTNAYTNLIKFGANANYNLKANLSNAANNYGQIPPATWNATSTINISNVSMSSPNDMVIGLPSAAGFGNINFDAPNLSGNGYRLFGNFKGVGSGASASPWIVTLQGNLALGRTNGYSVDLSSTTSTEYRYINIGGNLIQNAGTYILSDHSGTANSIRMIVAGNVNIDATYNGFTSAGGYSNPTYLIANVNGGLGILDVGGNLATVSGYNSFTGNNQNAVIAKGSTTGTCSLNFSGAINPQTASFNNTTFGGTGTIAMNITGAAGTTLISDLITPGTVNLTGGNFKIQSGKTLTLSGAVASSVNAGFTFNVDGTLRNSTAITPGAALTAAATGIININNGGIYEHNANTGSIPIASWQPGSTCFIRGITNNISGLGGMAQSFYNFLWKCSNQTVNVNLTANLGPHIYGNFTVDSTGLPSLGNSLRLNASSPATYALTADGNMSVNTGSLYLTSGTSTVTVACKDLELTNNAAIYLDQTSNAGNGILQVAGNLTAAAGTTITQLGTGTANEIQFTKSGTQVLTNAGAAFSNNLNYTINGNSVTQLSTSSFITVSKTSKLSLLTGGILDINNNTITINGLINTGSNYLGTIKGSSLSNIILGGTTGANIGTLYFTPGSQLLNNFTLNRTGAASSATLGSDLQIKNACALTSGALQLNGNTLTLNGTFTCGSSNAGSLTGSPTSNLIIGSTATSMPLTFTYDALKINNTLKSLTLNANASLANSTTSSSLYIAGGTSISPGNITVNGSVVFTTHDSLTLQSTANGTAYIGQNLSGNNYINGKVTIERYYPSHRSWRLVTAPVTSVAAPTINASWQEGVANVDRSSPVDLYPGYGTIITKSTAATSAGLNMTIDGYDQGSTNNPSILYYSSNKWLALPLGTNATAVTSQPGYMLFVRGNRTNYIVAGSSVAATDATLRVKGNMNMGTKNFSGAGFTVIGNPYPSAINFDGFISSGVNTPAYYYIWDPLMTGSNAVGAFITLKQTGAHSYIAVPDPTIATSQNLTPHSIDLDGSIQSGQAVITFYNIENAAAAGSSSVQETDKTNQSDNLSFRPTSPTSPLNNTFKSLRTNLYAVNNDNSISLQDAVLNLYQNNYSNAVDYMEDVPKLANFSENISLINENKNLSIDSRKNININDTIFYAISGLHQKNYKLEFIINGFMHSNLSAFLLDSFLHTRTAVNFDGETVIPFSVTADTASFAKRRFSIIFVDATNPLPVTFISVKALRQNNKTAIEWEVANQQNISQYKIERSTDGRNFTERKRVDAIITSQSIIKYNWLDDHVIAKDNYYRIVSIDNNGKLSYSNIVTIKKSPEQTGIQLLDANNGIINLQFLNMPKGSYKIRMLNDIGQQVASVQLLHAAENSKEHFSLGQKFAKGVYQLEIIDPYKKISIIKTVL